MKHKYLQGPCGEEPICSKCGEFFFNENEECPGKRQIKEKEEFIKEITVNLEFTIDCDVEKVIRKALSKKKIKINKYRYTYIDTNVGCCKFSNDLFLINLIDGKNGLATVFSWKLPDFSGKYTFKFQE